MGYKHHLYLINMQIRPFEDKKHIKELLFHLLSQSDIRRIVINLVSVLQNGKYENACLILELILILVIKIAHILFVIFFICRFAIYFKFEFGFSVNKL